MVRTKETDELGKRLCEMMEKDNQRYRRRQVIKKIMSRIGKILRRIFYPPLAVAFHAIAFIARTFGFISSFGLLVAAYNVYEMVVGMKSGIPFRELENIKSTGLLLTLPFMAYAVANLTENIYEYFEENEF